MNCVMSWSFCVQARRLWTWCWTASGSWPTSAPGSRVSSSSTPSGEAPAQASPPSSWSASPSTTGKSPSSSSPSTLLPRSAFLCRFFQGCGSGSVLDPYSIGSVDPDPYSESGSRRAKMTQKSRKKLVKVHVFKCWMASFESWRLLL